MGFLDRSIDPSVSNAEIITGNKQNINGNENDNESAIDSSFLLSFLNGGNKNDGQLENENGHNNEQNNNSMESSLNALTEMLAKTVPKPNLPSLASDIIQNSNKKIDNNNSTTPTKPQKPLKRTKTDSPNPTEKPELDKDGQPIRKKAFRMAHDQVDRQFPCDLCDKAYGRKSHLQRHIKQFHGEEYLHTIKNMNHWKTKAARENLIKQMAGNKEVNPALILNVMAKENGSSGKKNKNNKNIVNKRPTDSPDVTNFLNTNLTGGLSLSGNYSHGNNTPNNNNNNPTNPFLANLDLTKLPTTNSHNDSANSTEKEANDLLSSLNLQNLAQSMATVSKNSNF